VLSRQEFQIQIDLTMEQFKRTVPESFQRTLGLLKTNFKVSLFITSLNSGFDINHQDLPVSDIPLMEISHKEQEKSACEQLSEQADLCDCYPSSFEECPQNTTINGNVTIKGMVQAWFPLQSLLMSTLECFYNDTCLSQIKQYINSTVSPINFTTLKSSSLSLKNSTIESLANNLFIQSWINESSFESYFNHCHPLTCQYTYESRPDLIYIVTTIIGLIGGVNAFLTLLLPLVIKLVASIWNYVLQRHRGQTNTVGEAISIRSREKLYEKFL
jgi:hypothetical protein